MPDQPLHVDSAGGTREGHRIFRLSGPLTLSNLFTFQSMVRAETARVTVIDMTNVPYVDSAGIGLLMGAYVSRQKDGRSLLLVGVNERVQNTMNVTRVQQFFPIFPTVAEAENSAKA